MIKKMQMDSMMTKYVESKDEKFESDIDTCRTHPKTLQIMEKFRKDPLVKNVFLTRPPRKEGLEVLYHGAKGIPSTKHTQGYTYKIYLDNIDSTNQPFDGKVDSHTDTVVLKWINRWLAIAKRQSRYF